MDITKKEFDKKLQNLVISRDERSNLEKILSFLLEIETFLFYENSVKIRPFKIYQIKRMYKICNAVIKFIKSL